MRTGTGLYALVAMSIMGSAISEIGAATVHGCVWHSSKPVKTYTINWTTGSTSDRCLASAGSNAATEVSQVGLTCSSLGRVALGFTSISCLDIDGDANIKISGSWGMSYVATGAAYSGSTSSIWVIDGHSQLSNITIQDYNPGTNVCAEKSHCARTQVEWVPNTDAQVYVVFEPGQVGEDEVTQEVEL
ncbi:hypothetical protein F4779DRAFT_640392 [Xylariaceae sp. FL0662B]|nr:hypothetical protein F4779DRAFT_640392 [Xylariaceae sp. FL0662B]